MLATLVPVFKSDMSVGAYCLFAQKENLFENPHLLGTGKYDGAGNIVGIEVLENIKIDDLSKDSDIIVPVNNISIFADINTQFKGPKNRIMLLVDSSVKPEESYSKRLQELKQQGYKLAMRNLSVTQIESYKSILDCFSMFFIDCSVADPLKQGIICSKLIPNIKIGAENIPNQETFESLRDSNLFEMFEGPFYRVPINKQDTDVSPLRITYTKLLKIINTPDFDLTKVADVLSKDPALTIALLNVVNKLTLNSNISSIKQATALLGQKELKRWLNTVLVSKLCAEKPNEITRLSLIRAKFAENLATIFGLGMRTEELFLMGLFSVLDYIMDKPMEEALDSVSVSQDIFNALVNDEGSLAGVLDFEKIYEAGNWQEVSRLLVLHNIHMDVVYEAYLDSLKWYKNMFIVN